MQHVQTYIIAKSANASPSAAPEDQSAIVSEHEQLLPHTGGTEQCRCRENADHDGNSTQCQLCRRNTVNPTFKPRSDIACYAAYPRLTIKRYSYGKIEFSCPRFPRADPENLQVRTWRKKLSDRGTTLLLQVHLDCSPHTQYLGDYLCCRKVRHTQ